MLSHPVFVIARRTIDISLLIVVVMLVLITLTGGYRGDIFGFYVSAGTPFGPIKILFLLFLFRALLVLKTADFIFLLVSVILSMFFAEAVLRVWDAPITKFQLTQIHRPSPMAGWDLIPGASAVANTGAIYRINSRGCRDIEFSAEKPDGVFRILALGDSFTFGMGVESEATYPKQLEQILRGKGYSVEVINCAVIGYDMWQYTVALEEKVLAYHPDLITLGVFVNDLVASYPPPEVREPGYLGKNPFAKHGIRNRLHKSFLYNTIRNTEDQLKYRFRAYLGTKHLQGIAERKQVWGPANPTNILYQLLAGKADPRLFTEFKTALAEFVSIARGAGANTHVLLVPDSVQLQDRSLQELNKIVADATEASNIPFLDLTTVLEVQDNLESLYLFPDDAHNSPKGLRIIAEAISDAFERSYHQNSWQGGL